MYQGKNEICRNLSLTNNYDDVDLTNEGGN